MLMTSGAGSLWMTAPNEQLVLRVDPGSRKVIDRISVSGQPGAITYGAGAIWVASSPMPVTKEPAFDIYSRLLGERVVFLGRPIDEVVAVCKQAFWKSSSRPMNR